LGCSQGDLFLDGLSFSFSSSQKEKETKVNPDQIRRQRESFVRGREKNSICGAAFYPRISVVCRKSSNRFFAQARYQKPRCRDLLEGRLGSKNFLQVVLRFSLIPYVILYVNFRTLCLPISNGRH
jgi:hypothetical protein